MRAAVSHWTAVAALLPAGADAAWVQGELARIKANVPTELKRRHRAHLKTAQFCDLVPQVLPATVFDKEKLRAFRDEHTTKADFIARHRRRWRFWRYYELIDLAKQIGIDLGYTSKYHADRVDESGNILRGKPHGPGITYLMAAAAAIDAGINEDSARKLLQCHTRWQLSAQLGGSVGLTAGVTILDKFGNVRP